MAAETDDDQEPEGGEVQADPAPASVPAGPARLTTAADFVGLDNDRPVADESVPTGPGADAGAAPSAGKIGRPRTSESANARRMREKYARQKAQRATPPDFSGLPASGRPAPAPGAGNPPPAPAPAGPTGPTPILSDEQFRANAEAAVVVITGMLAMGLSKAWKVDNEEKEALTRDLAAVAKKHNWSGFSPEIALMMTGGMYILSRADDPETRRKIKYVIGKVRGVDDDKNASNAQNKVEKPATPTEEPETVID